ncbi:MAG: hypothetical protein A2057_00530 [Ignavibacteria bacterium GWA2_35_9]|nr:MAG: hypothetical protein A2057_00530 [Ignavibacteria bacterium GWA2_35_9]
MKKQFLFIVLVTIVLINLGCKKSLTEPVSDNTQPGRRDYVWKVDTLKLPEGYSTFLTRMWGSSPEDVWAVGDAYSSQHCLWHYDGTQWKNDPTLRNIYPSAIWGTDKNNVWLANSNSTIWHFDGSTWAKYTDLVLKDYSRIILTNMVGTTKENIYGVGIAYHNNGQDYKGVITHFDGSKWKFIDVPANNILLAVIAYNQAANEFLISGVTDDFPYYYRLFQLKNDQLIERFRVDNKVIALDEMGASNLVMVDKTLFSYYNGKLTEFKNLESTNIVGRLWVRNEKDFFTFTYDGIGHYNGIDLKTLFNKELNDVGLNTAYIFEKEVFFLFENSLTSVEFVVHGKLPN